MARQIVAWAPNLGSQEDFCMAEEFEVLDAGGRGSGKSEALVAIMLKYAMYPLYNGLILRRRLNDMLELRDRCMRLYKQVDPGCIWSRDDNRFVLSSGATIELGHCNLEEDKYKYQGREVQILGFDEAAQFTPTQYEEIKLCCRSKDPRMKPLVRLTANPGGISHSYFRDRFMLQPSGTVITEQLPDGRTLTRKWIKSTVYDNPILLKNDPQYLAVLHSIPDTRLRKMMLEGDWDAAEGMFFSTFDRLMHVKPLKEVFPDGIPPRGMRIFCSMDWGYATPFSIHWHAIDNMDRIVTFREYYGISTDPIRGVILPNVGLRLVASDVIDEFVRLSADLHGRIEVLVVDPSTKITSGMQTFSIFHEIVLQLQEHGIAVIPGNNDRTAGWNQMRGRLNLDPNTNNPWWMITDNCVHLIRTLSSLPEDPNNNYEPPKKSEDHAVDDARYAMMYVPLPLEQLQRRIADARLAEEERLDRDDDPLAGYRSGIESFRRRQSGANDRLVDHYITR